MCLSLAHMNQVLEINAQDMDCRVQVGAACAELWP